LFDDGTIYVFDLVVVEIQDAKPTGSIQNIFRKMVQLETGQVSYPVPSLACCC